ncbi:MAG: L-lactate permease [Anaerolineales bacterium]|nr:L-lactate permease [Anaerolineales bacterium]
MTLPDLTLFTFILAAGPILVVLYLMIGRNWGGSKAGMAGWLTAVFISLLFFGANVPLLLIAAGRAIFLALFVLYIIWMALLLYHVVNEAGVIRAIGQEMPRLATARPAQALLLAWIFGSFLQGATGFGVPAAVVAPLLVGLGFAADQAVTMALLGHAWAVTFGSLGSSFLSMIATTGLPGEQLASPAAAMLAIGCLGCGAGVLWLSDGRSALRQQGLFLLLITAVMSAVQWALAVAGLWTLAAFGGGLAGLIVAIVHFTRRGSQANGSQPRMNLSKLLWAFLPYGILIVVVVLGQLVIGPILDAVIIAPSLPATETRFGWQMPAGPVRSISLFGHAGALLLYTSLLAFGWYTWRGPLDTAVGPYSGRTIWQKTLKGSIKPTIGIYSLVAMALTMQHAGMTQLLAEALSANTGPIFPLLSPFIGALGAFMTGSNTNSNVVFGQLQQQTATALAISVPLILAAQTAGGAIGSLFAPAKVIVGCSTVSGSDEGRVLRLATLYGLAIVLIVGLVTLGIVWLAPAS